MRRAIYEAELGDDVFGEDPTVNRLEALAAERLGKEAAVLVASGTQGNLLGVLSHTRRGDEVVCGDLAHVFNSEVAGSSVIGGIQMRTVPSHDGALDPREVAAAIRPSNIHLPRTGVVCLENTHGASGCVVSPAQLAAVADVAHAHGVPVHLDGARVFNAAIALGLDVKEVAASVDSVTFCLSKGLGAPVGSLLCGSRDYVQVARKYRKMVGGGMRQAGIIAAAGIYALNHMVDRLADDHVNARVLAEGLAEIPGIEIDLEKVQSNLVFFRVSAPLGAGGLITRLRERGVWCAGGDRIRMVTHYGIERADVERAVREVVDILVGAPVGAR
jgi:threonine aldolase